MVFTDTFYVVHGRRPIQTGDPEVANKYYLMNKRDFPNDMVTMIRYSQAQIIDQHIPDPSVIQPSEAG